MRLNNNLVAVKVEDAPEQDESGIFVQDEWVKKRPIGTVQEVGADVHFCKKGDLVLFERYTSIPDPKDTTIRYCREDAILAIYDEDN